MLSAGETLVGDRDFAFLDVCQWSCGAGSVCRDIFVAVLHWFCVILFAVGAGETGVIPNAFYAVFEILAFVVGGCPAPVDRRAVGLAAVYGFLDHHLSDLVRQACG